MEDISSVCSLISQPLPSCPAWPNATDGSLDGGGSGKEHNVTPVRWQDAPFPRKSCCRRDQKKDAKGRKKRYHRLHPVAFCSSPTRGNRNAVVTHRVTQCVDWWWEILAGCCFPHLESLMSLQLFSTSDNRKILIS